MTKTTAKHEPLESQNNTMVLIKHEGLFRRLDIICPPPSQWCVFVQSKTTNNLIVIALQTDSQ